MIYLESFDGNSHAKHYYVVCPLGNTAEEHSFCECVGRGATSCAAPSSVKNMYLSHFPQLHDSHALNTETGLSYSEYNVSESYFTMSNSQPFHPYLLLVSY